MVIVVKNLPANSGEIKDVGLIPGSGKMEKDTATHSSILTWWIPWTKEPGGLQSMGLQRVGHNWSYLSHTHTHTHTHTQSNFIPIMDSLIFWISCSISIPLNANFITPLYIKRWKNLLKWIVLLFRELIKNICFLFSWNVVNYKAVWI